MSLWEFADLSTPWCVYVVATLRVADHIAAGARRIDALAAACGADPDALARVLRHLAGRGCFTEPAPGEFDLNDAARELLDEGARAGLDLSGIGGRMAYAWGTLLSAVRTGRPAYHEVFGRPFWEDLEANPEVAASFDALMGPGHGVPDPQILLDETGWESVHSVVDVGGGTGMLLAEILRAYPHVRGTLVDLPSTVARAASVFESAGVADRAQVSGRSFFDPLPAGADLYLMKNVLADWPDAEAEALLKRCAEAAGDRGRVVILGGVSPEDQPSPELLMLVLVGGKNRTLTEFQRLAASANLRVTSSGRLPNGRFAVECASKA